MKNYTAQSAQSVEVWDTLMSEEFEIDWIPEDTGAPYEAEDIHPDIPALTIDKLCKLKFGHTNWARMGQMSPEDLVGNPCEFDYENGVIFFKNAHMV